MSAEDISLSPAQVSGSLSVSRAHGLPAQRTHLAPILQRIGDAGRPVLNSARVSLERSVLSSWFSRMLTPLSDESICLDHLFNASLVRDLQENVNRISQSHRSWGQAFIQRQQKMRRQVFQGASPLLQAFMATKQVLSRSVKVSDHLSFTFLGTRLQSVEFRGDFSFEEKKKMVEECYKKGLLNKPQYDAFLKSLDHVRKGQAFCRKDVLIIDDKQAQTMNQQIEDLLDLYQKGMESLSEEFDISDKSKEQAEMRRRGGDDRAHVFVRSEETVTEETKEDIEGQRDEIQQQRLMRNEEAKVEAQRRMTQDEEAEAEEEADIRYFAKLAELITHTEVKIQERRIQEGRQDLCASLGKRTICLLDS